MEQTDSEAQGNDGGMAEVGNIRTEYTGKYRIDRHAFLMSYHYCLQYQRWKDEYNAITDTNHGIDYAADKVQTSPNGDSLERTAIRMAELSERIGLIESTAKQAGDDLYKYLLIAVTNEGIGWKYLKYSKGMPCERTKYYEMRRHFYYLISQKIN